MYRPLLGQLPDVGTCQSLKIIIIFIIIPNSGYVPLHEIIIIIIISPNAGDLAPITSAVDEKQELIRSSKAVATAVGLLLLLTTAAIQSPASAQFCPPSYRKKNPQHTACMRRNTWCRIKVPGVHPEMRASILKMHNDFRSQTTLGKLPGFPTAADMQELLWDDELPYVAQAHASLCTTPDVDLKHDEIENRFTNRFEQTGQNTAWIGRSNYEEGANWTWPMDGWFTKEYPLYLPRGVVEFASVKAPATLERITDTALRDLKWHTCLYNYDDVLAFAPDDFTTHLQRLRGYVRRHEITIIIISPNAGDLAPITSASDEKQELIRSSKMVATAVGLLLLLTTAAIQSPASAQFCPPSYRQKNPQHTACKRRNMWCRIKVSGVNSTERALILKLHNDFRGQTALGKLPGFSTAADMQELLWDDELEYVAQAHASLCTTPDGDLKHDDVKSRFTSRFEKTGQNLAWIGRSNYKEGANWTWAMDGWFTKEYPLYPPRGVVEFAPVKNAKIGHFTQIIWAKTRYVGCGYVYYNVDGARYPHMRQYTCNYGPSGNYKGKRIYQEGPTCSACPNSTRCLWTAGLCSGPPGGQSWGRPPYNRRPPVGRTSPRPTPTPSRRTPGCPPCPCLRSMLQRYPSPHATHRRDPPYAQDPAPRPYPLPYDSRLGGGLPGCKGVEGYKPGEPGQPTCVENDSGGSGGIPRADYSDGAHDGRPGPGADFWLSFVTGVVTVLSVAALSVFFVFWRANASADRAEAKLSTDATVTPAY
ncbi:uncharacterized protein [Dermacentor andersoni]|uniref:uncharacterized protein n=1 Tax=Dermacentor andersoni TaxID=34620 RepID=UPI0024161DC1|nr:uncharacterized protein LOC126544124 [Dermacentor andersoni]